MEIQHLSNWDDLKYFFGHQSQIHHFQLGCHPEMDRDGRDIIQCVCATDLCNMPLPDEGIARSTVDSSAHLSHLIIAYLPWVQIVLYMK